MPDTYPRGGGRGAGSQRGPVSGPGGPDAYLALAGRRLADAAAGAGQLLFVAGEAGIGKTRLLGVIARQADAQGFAVIRAAAFPGDGQSLAVWVPVTLSRPLTWCLLLGEESSS